jgi:predicted amidohydrolase YtcJ
MDALRVYTMFGAYSSFEEQTKGTLDMKVDVTIIDGVVRYERPTNTSSQ